MKMIDLRSDTVTMPTEAMRAAMADAEVGDDVYGDDPTVNRLQNMAAEMLGKEAALFLPSGTMGNQLAIMVHTRRGEELICLRNSHVYQHEAGSAALLSGVTMALVDSEDGMLSGELVGNHVRDDDIHCPPTTLVCTENALATGQAVPLARCREVYEAAKERGLAVHMDGARIFSAAAALDCSAADIARYADSVMFCLSKGLCAPVGSMLAGTRAFIEKAVRGRKILGGAMRQAGVLAAAGILSLTEMTRRVGQDNRSAERLAQKLDAVGPVTVLRPGIQINMVFFKVDMPADFLTALPQRMLARGVRMNPVEQGEFRFVTHNDISDDDIDDAVNSLCAEIEKG